MRTLYFGYISPYSRKIRVVLAEKGLDYDPVTVQAAQADVSFNALNPARRVPAFVDGDQTLFESQVIVEYLLRTYRGNAEGAPPFAETLCRPDHYFEDLLVLNAIETMLDSGLVLLQMRNNGITAEQSEYLGREAGRIQVILDWLEARAKPEGFVPGTFSVQDMNLVITLQWCDYRSMFDWSGRPNLQAIVTQYAQRPSMSSTVPELAP